MSYVSKFSYLIGCILYIKLKSKLINKYLSEWLLGLA